MQDMSAQRNYLLEEHRGSHNKVLSFKGEEREGGYFELIENEGGQEAQLLISKHDLRKI